MVVPSDDETWLVTDLRGPVTRIKRHLGIGVAAETVKHGFVRSMTLIGRASR
jgi:hypothetical protein